MNNENTEQALEASTLAIKNDKIDLIGHLHGLILFSIASLYYKDSLTLIFLLRAFSQIQIAVIGVRIVITASVVSFLTHLLHSLPEPSNNGSNYGILVDFIGETRPSRLGTLSLDLLVLALQLLYLALLHKKSGDATSEQTDVSEATVAQDIEAEEQGISRRSPPRESEVGIELQSLLPDGTERERETAELEDNIILLGKKDLIEIFTNPSGAAQSAESADAVRRFIQRVNAVRARRAQNEAAPATTTPAAPTTPL